MSLVNFTNREITWKIVYYGPGRSGKTTNLLYVHRQVPADRKGKMVSLATTTERTLFFDFLPLNWVLFQGLPPDSNFIRFLARSTTTLLESWF